MSERFSCWSSSDQQFWIDLLQRGEDSGRALRMRCCRRSTKAEREPRRKNGGETWFTERSCFAVLDGGGESAKLEQVTDGLRARGLDAFVKMILEIVRGLAYYTGIVLRRQPAGKFRALAGGGRYDNLIARPTTTLFRCPQLDLPWVISFSAEVDRSNSGRARAGRDGRRTRRRRLHCGHGGRRQFAGAVANVA